MEKGEISIWFLIGVSLLVNGVLICGAGIYEYIHPPLEKLVLFDKHAGIWWGAILLLTGLLYCIRFVPRWTAGK
jgi:hypothetical protein